MDLGFLLKNGHEAMSMRSVFSQFFFPERLAIYAPDIKKIIDQYLEQIILNFNNIKEQIPEGYANTSKLIF